MKKIFLLAVALGLTFTSCSNDDDENAANEFSMVGVWQPSRQIVVSGSNGVTLSNTDFSPCYKSSTFDFKADNTVVSNIFENNISNNCVSAGIETVPYSYDHAASKLVIDNENVEIVSRTQNELQFVSEYDDIDGDGTDDKVIIVIVK